MATIVLQIAGSAIGSALGGPIGSAIGSAVGAYAGSMIDRSLIGGGKRLVEGPRLKQLDGISATEGAPVPRVYGRARVGGQVIWATRFEEETQVVRQGKSGGKSSSKPKTTTTTYLYFANLAVALCEGPIAMVRRVWADGKPLDLTTVTMRVHRGDEGQGPDPLIVARQGDAPAYRGVAYVVFERLPLTDYGNRLPQLSFEVVRPVEGLAQMIRGVDLIPGATEFGYAGDPVSRVLGFGASASENRNQLTHAADIDASLDALEQICPNAASVACVVSWFGNDLRAGACLIRPAVDQAGKETMGAEWSVAGVTRAAAEVVSQVDGRAAYGGTPSDASVIGLIADLKARGLSPVYYPFVMMDVPAGNTLPDPWTGAATQPAYPWRGRITCHPAPGQPGSPDGAGAAATQVATFFGTVTAAHFSVAGGAVAYSGPAQWSYSRFVLHNAALCAAAGGVDAFIIGSELVGLTRVRSTLTVYAAASRLRTLAAEVRALLGPGTKIGYAADWSEYGAHVRNGGADVGFPLDPLWSDANIDFVGIDYYPPVSDWRDGTAHLDAQQFSSGVDVAYLKDRLGGGEAFDWYYASEGARTTQTRTPITDGAFGKPWVFRAKDLVGWWSNAHRPRVAGVESAATGWVAASKPIWLTEVGCPAVDKGANSPNLFPDPKSSESGYPPFSGAVRDDLAPARLLEAVMERFDPARPGFVSAHNPVSGVYGGRMVDAARIHVWAWDARPYPAFPHLAEVWGDAANWVTGHWINGRIEGAPLDRLIRQICKDYGLPAPATLAVDGFVDGYVIDRPLSARAALEPLENLFGVDASIRAGAPTFAGRGRGAVRALTRDDLIPDRNGRETARTRAQETELPRQITVGFADAESQYKQATASSRRLATASRREETVETTAVLTRSEAKKLADRALQDLWISRETTEFTLRPGLIALEPGDLVTLPEEDETYQITRITDGAGRQCAARRIEPAVFDSRAQAASVLAWSAPRVPGPPLAVTLALPADPGDPVPLGLLALRAEPWLGPYILWRSADGASFAPAADIGQPAALGDLTAPLAAGPLWLWDRKATLELRLAGAALASFDEMAALRGDGRLAVKGPDGLWEILSWREAALVSPGVWRLATLLRGLFGTEPAAARSAPAGSPVVLLDGALTPLFTGEEDFGASAFFRVAPASRDHADPGAVAFAASASALPLAPYAPVHPRARRTGAGVELSFIRRSRRDGDNWDAAEIPLGEEAEAYTVEVFDGATLKRVFEAATPGFLYPAAMEITDFGAQQTQLSLRVRQISRIAGPGAALIASVPVRTA